jgi:hypothetical protein
MGFVEFGADNSKYKHFIKAASPRGELGQIITHLQDLYTQFYSTYT